MMLGSRSARRSPWGGIGAAVLLLGAAAAVDASDDRYVSASLGGYIDGLAVVDTGGAQRERPQALADLWFEGQAGDLLFGRAEARAAVGGPFEGADTGVFNFTHTFQNRSPSLDLREAYAEIRLHDADLRLGLQTFAWGKLDGVAPTDVLNPRDYHDPIVVELEEAKIGVPAVVVSYYPPDVPRLDLGQLQVTAAYVPLAVPARLPLADERWFPPSTDFTAFVVPEDIAGTGMLPIGSDFTIPVDLRTANSAPPKTFRQGGIGLRIGGTWREVDWALYHYTGPETGPNLDIETELIRIPGSPLEIRASTTLRQAHSTMHMTGFDWTTAIGAATLRAEAAFFQNRAYLRRGNDIGTEFVRGLTSEEVVGILGDLLNPEIGRATLSLGDLFVKRDSAEWGIGVDYLWHGVFALLQMNQTALFEDAPTLLIGDPDTRFTLVVRRSFLRERLEVEIRNLYAIEQGSWFVFPRISYLLLDDLRLRIGYLVVGGSKNTLFGQFKANDELVLQVRYSF